MITYKVYYDPNGSACVFETRSGLHTEEYCINFTFDENGLYLEEVETIQYGQFFNENPQEFEQTHKEDLFWLRYFMNRWYGKDK